MKRILFLFSLTVVSPILAGAADVTKDANAVVQKASGEVSEWSARLDHLQRQVVHAGVAARRFVERLIARIQNIWASIVKTARSTAAPVTRFIEKKEDKS